MKNVLPAQSKVLIIDDDPVFRKSIKYGLKDYGIDAYYSESVQQALELFTQADYDLIIMDIQFARMDGVALLQLLRKKRDTIPILILSSSDRMDRNLLALEAGADQVFERKSTPMEYLLGHARALLIRNEARCAHQEYDRGNLIIDVPSRIILVQGAPIDLQRKEFDIFSYLASHPNQVLTRDQIFERIWGTEVAFNVDATVRYHITNLRKKLSVAGKNYIKTEWGVGYKFIPAGEEYKPEKGFVEL